jgi:hypothetical protein
MKQLVKILFHIENKKEQVDKVVSGLHEFFGMCHQDAYEMLSKEYIWIVERFSPIELELDFPEHSTEKDMYNCLITAFSEIPFECQINDEEFNYTPAFSKTKDTVIENSETVRIITKAGYTIIRTEELEKLKRAKSALKDLRGISKALENKFKTLSNDIRTISES